MRALAAILLFTAASLAAAQDSRPSTSEQKEGKDTQFRIRSEGSAGGLGEITEQEKRGAAAGAGPHREFNPGGEGRGRTHDESSSDREAGRGATGGERINSGDAAKPSPRP